MWVNLPGEEKAVARKIAVLKSMAIGLLLFTLLFIASIVYVKLGCGKWHPCYDKTWKEVWETLPVLSGINAALAIGMAIQIRLSGRKYICLSCENTSKTSKLRICSCGGRVVPINEAKWIDEASKS
jgi:hypothetical protein